MEFETLSVMALGTAFLSITASTAAYLASPQNWPVSLLLALAAVVMFAFVAFQARNRIALA
jgi:hypothetical protein